MRLIDVDALRVSDGINDDGVLYIPWRDIASAPTVNPIKRGKWIKVGANESGQVVISCSNCHCSDFLEVKPNYCWHCGSKNEEIV